MSTCFQVSLGTQAGGRRERGLEARSCFEWRVQGDTQRRSDGEMPRRHKSALRDSSLGTPGRPQDWGQGERCGGSWEPWLRGEQQGRARASGGRTLFPLRPEHQITAGKSIPAWNLELEPVPFIKNLWPWCVGRCQPGGRRGWVLAEWGSQRGD